MIAFYIHFCFTLRPIFPNQGFRTCITENWELWCCNLQLFTPHPTSSCRPLEDFHTFYMSAANWMSVYNEPYMTKCSLHQLKAFTSPRPSPALEVLSALTACCRRRASLPGGNCPSVFLCFIASSWPPQHVSESGFVYSSVLVNICGLTQRSFARPLVSTTDAHSGNGSNILNRIEMQKQCRHKKPTAYIILKHSGSFEPLINKHY